MVAHILRSKLLFLNSLSAASFSSRLLCTTPKRDARNNGVTPIASLREKPATSRTSWAEAADRFFSEKKPESGHGGGTEQGSSTSHFKNRPLRRRIANPSFGRSRNDGNLRLEKGIADSSTAMAKLRGDAVYGVAPVYAALHACRRVFHCLYVQEKMTLNGKSGKKKDKQAVSWILENAASQGLRVKETSKHDLNVMVDNRPHQGLVLDASPLELILVNGLEAPWSEEPQAPVWVALDEVTDPQNFGAVLRSAYFLGAEGVVVCARNSAPLSGVVSKASAGALELMEVRSCRNMVKFLEASTENGWRTVGTSSQSNGMRLRDLPCGVPSILVLGSEGKGLRTNVSRACSNLVSIPGFASTRKKSFEGKPATGHPENGFSKPLKREDEEFVAVESLNVSVAAGILLHELINHMGS